MFTCIWHWVRAMFVGLCACACFCVYMHCVWMFISVRVCEHILQARSLGCWAHPGIWYPSFSIGSKWRFHSNTAQYKIVCLPFWSLCPSCPPTGTWTVSVGRRCSWNKSWKSTSRCSPEPRRQPRASCPFILCHWGPSVIAPLYLSLRTLCWLPSRTLHLLPRYMVRTINTQPAPSVLCGQSALLVLFSCMYTPTTSHVCSYVQLRMSMTGSTNLTSAWL